jgi:hypothetical protein
MYFQRLERCQTQLNEIKDIKHTILLVKRFPVKIGGSYNCSEITSRRAVLGGIVDHARLVTSAGQSRTAPRRNQREYPRITTNLTGRYMLADGREFECTVFNVALGGIALSCPVLGALNESIVVYIDQLGRLQGKIIRFVENGFVLKLSVTTRAAKKLAIRLDEIKAQGAENGPEEERRQEPRIEADDKVAHFSLSFGDGADCEVLDLSRTGAEIRTRNRPPIGTSVQLGRLRGIVVRHTDAGVGIKFEESPESVSLTDRFHEITLPERPDE